MNATQSLRPIEARRVTWGVVLGGAALFLLLLETARFSSLRHLDQTWITTASPPFSGGVQSRELLHRMSGAILRFQLTDQLEFSQEFDQAAKLFNTLTEPYPSQDTETNLQTAALAVHQEFQRYQREVQELLQRGLRGVRRETPALIEGIVREKARPLHAAIEQLIVSETRSWELLLTRNRESIRRLRQSSWLSTACSAILCLGGILIWTGKVPPIGGPQPQTKDGLLRQERLASLGTLAAGVAHEIRNPLTALKFRIFSFRKELPAELREHEDLDIVSKEINRLERIVKDFLEFARPSEPQRTEVLAGPLMEDVYELLRSELARRGLQVRLETNTATRIWADRQQLQQVLINLVQNAAESTQEAGTITLRVRQGAAQFFRRTQPMVLFEVMDTGKGIPPDVEAHVFDPFFSTKEGGSGLGLSIAARIAEMHDGHIQFASQVGRGTTFTLVLPQAKPHESTDTPDRR